MADFPRHTLAEWAALVGRELQYLVCHRSVRGLRVHDGTECNNYCEREDENGRSKTTIHRHHRRGADNSRGKRGEATAPNPRRQSTQSAPGASPLGAVVYLRGIEKKGACIIDTPPRYLYT